MQLSSLHDDRIDPPDFFRRRFNPVQTPNHGGLVRRRHTESAQIPIHLARVRADHPTQELTGITNFERNIHSVYARRSERGVMDVWRDRMAYGPAHQTENLRLPIDFINSVYVSQVFGN